MTARSTPHVPPEPVSILAGVSRSDIRLDPYPHLLVEDILPDALYRHLEATFPAWQRIAGEDATENNKACLLSAREVGGDEHIDAVWRRFFDYHTSAEFFAEFVELWAPTVERIHPHLARHFGKRLTEFEVGLRSPGKAGNTDNRSADIMLDCLFGINTPVRSVTPVRGPHIDSAHKLFSSLLYFRAEDDDSTGGEHQMYRVRRRMYPPARMKRIPARYVEPVGEIPYRGNYLLFWLNSAESIHGVTPRGVTGIPRRYVAVMGECYRARGAGYFAHHPEWESWLGRLRCRLQV